MPLRVLLFGYEHSQGQECISLLCRTCEPNIFVHLHCFPFIGIFVNLDSCFVKSLGMLTSTALQTFMLNHFLLFFSSSLDLLELPIDSAYQGHLGGKRDSYSQLRQDQLISGWQLSVLLKQTNKQTNQEEEKSESLSNSVFFASHHLRIPFSLSLRYC